MNDVHAEREPETPARALDLPLDSGCRVLSRRPAAYTDGSEESALRIVQRSTDRSSTSDELIAEATTWPERYHFAIERANVMRGLRLPPESAVLEVGSGCGAITRYLGETVRAVDAVEPVRSRALVGRLRTSDLDNVEVFIGRVEDLPEVPTYDLIFVIGVLEYVAAESGDHPHVSWLRRLRSLLKPHGQLVCAIENQLGVKYLVGAPEDHSGRSFDGIEGYPDGGRAVTFTRRRLREIFQASGFGSTRFLGAFPDYKLTRALIDDELIRNHPDLAVQLPQFPSPEWVGDRPKLADERSVWRTLLDADLGEHFSNSYVVLAGTSPGSLLTLWPEDRHAVYFSVGRRARFQTKTVVRDTANGLIFDRSRLTARDDARAGGGIVHRVASAPRVPDSVPLTDLLAGPAHERGLELLRQWAQLPLLPDAAGAVDCIPRNVLVHGSELVLIDQEWVVGGWSPRDIVRRGLMLLALDLMGTTLGDRLDLGRGTDLLQYLSDAVEEGCCTAWLHDLVEREARFQVMVATPRRSLDETVQDILEALERSLEDTPMGTRTPDLLRQTEARLLELEHRSALYLAAESRLFPFESTRRRLLRSTARVLRRRRRQ